MTKTIVFIYFQFHVWTGATLKQRDKERFRLALRDIKDYEIYKQVMETAMMKLQQQLASVVQQNEDMRRAKVAEERQNQRQRR